MPKTAPSVPEPVFTHDVARYTSAPIFNLAGGISLSRALLAAMPADMPAMVKKAAKKLDGAVHTAEAAWAARQRQAGQSSAASYDERRSIDASADRAWGALRMRLEAAALLPVEEFPQARRAQELLGLLFPEGARFLARRYPEQLAEMDLRLRRIDAEKLAKDLDALCDPAYLKFIRKIHPQYQAMAQAAHLATESKAESLFHHVQALRQAIIEYATKVCASADSDEPATVRRAQTALRPLEVEREQRAQRGGGPGEPPEPEPAPAPPSPG